MPRGARVRARTTKFLPRRCFAGVAIVADVFMAAIEHITSQKKTLVHNGHEFRVNVWNDTVANLTLMALGSSAPEILLSCIELFRGDGNLTMVAGKLGPSTIVGSAAFNLLGISAVCVSGRVARRCLGFDTPACPVGYVAEGRSHGVGHISTCRDGGQSHQRMSRRRRDMR